MGTTRPLDFLHQRGKPILPIVLSKFVEYNGKDGRTKYANIIDFAYYQLDVKNQAVIDQLRKEVSEVIKKESQKYR